jgi:hypothetical protein
VPEILLGMEERKSKPFPRQKKRIKKSKKKASRVSTKPRSMRYPDGKKTSRPLDFPSAFGKHRNLEVKFKHLGGSLSPHQAEMKIKQSDHRNPEV